MAQDECSTALALEPGVPVFIDTTNATGSTEPVDDAQCAGTFLDWGDPGTNPDVWLAWTPNESGLATFSTCDTAGFDTSMVIYEGSCGGLTQVACNGDGTGGVDCQAFYSRIADFGVTGGVTYYVRIGGWQGDSGTNTVSLEFLPFSGACADAEGSCAEPHPTPGCDDASCCSTVCDFEPFCCDVEWDDFCVASAIKLCGIYVYECPNNPSAPANNCPTDPIVVESGDVVAFDTTLADTVGPEADCGSGKNDTQIHSDLWYQFTTPSSGGVLTASTCSTATFDTKIGIYAIGDGTFEPSDLPNLPFACNEDGTDCGNFTSLLEVILVADTTYLVRLGGYLFETGTGTISFEFQPDATACGEPDAGTCCEPQPGPFCAEGECCDTVCGIDPFCCDTQWDGACAELAFVNCSPLCGEPVPPQECTTPGANPLATTGVFDGTGGIACQADGITTPNTYAVVFTQADLGSAYSFNCVDFGLDNSGGYLEGDISVWIDENGGDPSINDVTLVASYPVGLYNGDDQQVTVTGDLQCIELTGDQTLVVTLDIPQAADGFATFAGAATGFTTYILSDACGIGDFATLDSIGFPNNKWWVELSGNDGCDGGIPGDLNADGAVNGADLAILAGAWGTADPIADLDGSGEVNGADLSILLGNWTG